MGISNEDFKAGGRRAHTHGYCCLLAKGQLEQGLGDEYDPREYISRYRLLQDFSKSLFFPPFARCCTGAEQYLVDFVFFYCSLFAQFRLNASCCIGLRLLVVRYGFDGRNYSIFRIKK